MGKALRCDNPECRKFFDVHEPEETWSEVNMYLKKSYPPEKNWENSTVITTSTCISNTITIPIPSSSNYILCSECTKKLKKLLGYK